MKKSFLISMYAFVFLPQVLFAEDALEQGTSQEVTVEGNIANEVLWLYQWAVILAALFNMLAQFGVLDTRNRIVWSIGDFLYRITEPALSRIRRVVPSFGSIDLSPLVLIFGIYILQQILQRIYAAIVYGNISGLFL